MASTTASRPPALMPVSIRMGEHTVDMSVPTNVALAEFAPNIVSQITQLSASSASQGYRITNSQGRVLDQSQTLINQGIQAGSVLILSKSATAHRICAMTTWSRPWEPRSKMIRLHGILTIR